MILSPSPSIPKHHMIPLPPKDDNSDVKLKEITSSNIPDDSWTKVENARISLFQKYEISEQDTDFNPFRGDEEITMTKKLKNIIRYGIPDSRRKVYWLNLTGGLSLIHSNSIYYKTIKKRVKMANILIKDQWDNDSFLFGMSLDFIKNYCGEDKKLVNFIKLVNFQNRNITYAPLIPKVCSLLLTHLSKENAYAAIQGMINNNDEFWYFSTTHNEFTRSSMSIHKIMKRKCPKTYSHLLKSNIDPSELFLKFIFDSNFVPDQIELTLFDSFLNEGRKILFRFFLCFMIMESKQIIQAKTKEELDYVLITFYRDINNSPSKLKPLIKQSFELQLSRNKHIDSADISNQVKKNTSIRNFQTNIRSFPSSFSERSSHLSLPFRSNSTPPNQGFYSSDVGSACDNNDTAHSFDPQSLSNQRSLTDYDMRHKLGLSKLSSNIKIGHVLRSSNFEVQSEIISNLDYMVIQSFLPTLYRNSNPKRVYKLSVDGTSFSTFLRACPKYCPYLLVIKTVNSICGAFLSDSPGYKSNHGHFFGRCSTFVFSNHETGSEDDVSGLKIYAPSSDGDLANDYFILVETNSIQVGGPSPAIYIQDNMKKLLSSPCQTFSSPSFTKNVSGDYILDIELLEYMQMCIRR